VNPKSSPTSGAQDPESSSRKGIMPGHGYSLKAACKEVREASMLCLADQQAEAAMARRQGDGSLAPSVFKNRCAALFDAYDECKKKASEAERALRRSGRSGTPDTPKSQPNP